MTALTAWIPYVQVPNAPRAMTIDAIRTAAREFCADTMTWQFTQDPVTVYVGEPEYVFEPPSDAEAVQVWRAWYDGKPIELKTEAQLEDLFPGASWMTATGTPRYLVQLRLGAINVVPIPDVTKSNALILRIALQPTRTATEIDDDIFDHHRDSIAAGARAKLKLMKHEPFFDAEGGVYADKLFKDDMATERIRVWRGYGSVNLTARNPFGKFA